MNPRERRLVLRLLEYWRDLSGDRDMPAVGDVDASAIADMWQFCFVIDLAGEARFTHFGSWHAEFGGADMTGLPLAQLRRDTLAERATRYIDQVSNRRIPITYGGELQEPVGRHILYRSIMLPLSDDAGSVGGILGGANCKLASSQAEG